MGVQEPRWQGSAEEYRAIQALVRSGRYQEALDRAERVLQVGQMGRKHAARLHSLICWLHTDGILRPSPIAALHGEEAVRLAELAGDEWIKCEALSRLVHAYCQMGDAPRAHSACQAIAAEAERNDAVITGGLVALRQLEALVAATAGDVVGCLSRLEEAENVAGKVAPAVAARVRVQKVGALLEHGRYAEASRVLKQSPPSPQAGADALEWEIARAWLAVAESPAEQSRPLLEDVSRRAQASGNTAAAAQCLALQALMAGREGSPEAGSLARQALHRAITAGRLDLAGQFRRRLAALL